MTVKDIQLYISDTFYRRYESFKLRRIRIDDDIYLLECVAW